MAISDLFSTSFLFSIAIIVILIGGIFAYVSYRMAEQDHKLNSMLGVITAMADELRFFRSRLTDIKNSSNSKDNEFENTIKQEGGINKDLINVSDDEDEDEEEYTNASTVNNSTDDDDEDNENVEDDEDDDDDDDVDVDDVDEDNVEEDTQIKLLNIDLIPEEVEVPHIEDFNIEELNLNDEIADSNNTHLKEEIKTIHISDLGNLSSHNNDILEEDYEEITESNKNILLIDETNTDENKNKHEYKKLSLNKLREVVIEKGLISDASKLKKNEILKLLGIE